MRLIPIALFVAVGAAGCSSGGGNNAAGSNGAAPATAENADAPAAASGTLTPAWMAGRWQAADSGPCEAGDTYFTLEPDGRYAFMEEEGRWTLDGNRLTIEVTRESSDSHTAAGQRHSTVVTPKGADEAEWQTDGQPPIRMNRCK